MFGQECSLDDDEIKVRRRVREPFSTGWLFEECSHFRQVIEQKARLLVDKARRGYLVLDRGAQQVLILFEAVISPGQQVAHEVVPCCERTAAQPQKVVIWPQAVAHKAHELVAALAPRRSRKHVVRLGGVRRFEGKLGGPKLMLQRLNASRAMYSVLQGTTRPPGLPCEARRGKCAPQVKLQAVAVEDHVLLNPVVKAQPSTEVGGEVIGHQATAC
mmetsp:Transcript_32586/g.85627  ORF Transcript_32586/g.85627 Transcript_32586/m.85627 type:complete len:216 (-) Transcript_32586:345-992(-)